MIDYIALTDEHGLSEDIIKNIVDIYQHGDGEIDDIVIKSSNGSSFVFITNSRRHVCQYFSYDSTIERITNIHKLIEIENILIRFNNDDSIIYNIYEYITKISHVNRKERIIFWEQIVTLNSFPDDTKNKIIENNLIKLLWDVGKALHALHLNDIHHKDARIDNIGIKDNNFILYDFDGSSPLGYSDERDTYDFLTSIKFYIGDNSIKKIFPNIVTHDLINNLYKELYKSRGDNTIEYLDNLKIVF